jgi:hypothetical protein
LDLDLKLSREMDLMIMGFSADWVFSADWGFSVDSGSSVEVSVLRRLSVCRRSECLLPKWVFVAEVSVCCRSECPYSAEVSVPTHFLFVRPLRVRPVKLLFFPPKWVSPLASFFSTSGRSTCREFGFYYSYLIPSCLRNPHLLTKSSPDYEIPPVFVGTGLGLKEISFCFN